MPPTETAVDPGKEKTFICHQTGKEQVSKTGKLPRGWKVINGENYSPDGRKLGFMTRGLMLAIGWPQDKEEQKELIAIGRVASAQSRSVANATMSQLFVHDNLTLTDKGKLPKYEHVYLYPILREKFSAAAGVSSGLIASITHSLESLYRKMRWEVAIGKRTIPSFRSWPYPVRAQDIKLWVDEEDHIHFRATVAQKRIQLQLVRKSASPGKSPGPGRDNSRTFNTLMDALKAGLPWGECRFKFDRRGNPVLLVVMTLPKPAAKVRSGMFHVRSDKDALIVALNDKDERLWVYNADQLIARKSAHKRMLQRCSDDTKFEDRPTPGLARKRTAAVDRQRRFLKTFVEQIAASIVNYANRRNLAAIKLDLRDKSFINDFNWYALRMAIESGCDKHGIALEVVADPGLEQDPDAAVAGEIDTTTEGG